MFRHFGLQFPAFAGVDFDRDEFVLARILFQHGKPCGKRSRGRGADDELFERGWGSDQRTRRGDIKFILLELLSDRPSHGYDLIKAMESRYGGFRRLSPGSVYPTLQMLEESGYLTSEQENGKRIYTMTDAGREFLAAHAPQETSESARDTRRSSMAERSQEFVALRNEVVELTSIIAQVARRGKPEQLQQVRERLEQLKREIYAMLATE